MWKKYFALFLVVFVVSHTFATRKVYLLHGFGGTRLQLEKINKALIKNGFTTEIYSYPSLIEDVDTVGQLLFEKIQSEQPDTVSFVTHSMGGLVVRAMYEHIDTARVFPFVDRVVMIAPPNNGSPVADYLAQYEFFRFVLGPNINNLTTNSKTGAARYPFPSCEVGLIAGKHGDDAGYNSLIPHDNDGVLDPETTKMGIEKDVIFVNAWHNGLLSNKKVIKATILFLKSGRFKALPKPQS